VTVMLNKLEIVTPSLN